MNRLKIDFLKHSLNMKIMIDGKRQGEPLAPTNAAFGRINPRDISEGGIPRFKV